MCDVELGFPFGEPVAAADARTAIIGIESCRLRTESANRLLTGDPETVDTIKYMETVCD